MSDIQKENAIMIKNEMPNSKEDVDKYLSFLRNCPGVKYCAQAKEIATNYASSRELEIAIDALEYVSVELQKEEPGITMLEALKRGSLEESEYYAIAKLIPFEDKYDDTKLLFLLDHGHLYTQNGESRIEDRSLIEKIGDDFGKIREGYYQTGNPTLSLLEAQIQMVINRESFEMSKSQKKAEADSVYGIGINQKGVDALKTFGDPGVGGAISNPNTKLQRSNILH